MEDKEPKTIQNKKKEKTYVPKKRVAKKKGEVILVKQSALIVLIDGHSVQIPKGKHVDVVIGDKIEVET